MNFKIVLHDVFRPTEVAIVYTLGLFSIVVFDLSAGWWGLDGFDQLNNSLNNKNMLIRAINTQ